METEYKLSEIERQIVDMRYMEGRSNSDVAAALGLSLHQVKYRVRRPAVRHYIASEFLPRLRKAKAVEFVRRISDPLKAYVEKLIADAHAMRYQYFNGGKRVVYPDNMVQIRALRRISRIYGIAGDQKNFCRDFRKAVSKYLRQNIAKVQLLIKELSEEDVKGKRLYQLVETYRSL